MSTWRSLVVSPEVRIHKYEVPKKKRVGKYEIQKVGRRESQRDRDTHTHTDMAGILPKGVSTMRCLQRLYTASQQRIKDAGEAGD